MLRALGATFAQQTGCDARFALQVEASENFFDQKGGQNSSIALDQTGCGAILRVCWGPLDRTFPTPNSSASALGAKNHCFGPWARVLRGGQKKRRNGAEPEPAIGDGRGGGGARTP